MKALLLTILTFGAVSPTTMGQKSSDFGDFCRRTTVTWRGGDRVGFERLLHENRSFLHRFYVHCEIALLEGEAGRVPSNARKIQAVARVAQRAFNIDFYLELAEKVLRPAARKSWPDRVLAWKGHPPGGDPLLASLVSVELARGATQRFPPGPLPFDMRDRIRLLLESGCPDGALDGLVSLGTWHQLRGEYFVGDRALRSAERLDRRICGGRGHEIARKRGELALKREDFVAARAHFTTAFQCAIGPEKVVARAHLAQTHAYLLDQEQAAAEAARVVKELDTVKASTTRALVLLILAEVDRRLGKFDPALARNRQAEAILSSGEDSDTHHLLFVRRQRGHLFMVMGRFTRAEEELKAGLEGARRLQDRMEEIYHLRYLADLAFLQAKEGQTLNWGVLMLEAARREQAGKEIAFACRFLGKVYLRWGILEDAALYLEEGLEVAGRLGISRWKREIVRDLLKVMEKLGRSEEARRFEAMLRKDLFKGRSVSRVGDLLLLARLAWRRGESEEAARDLDAAVKILEDLPEEIGDPMVEWFRGAVAVEAAEQTESQEEALDYLDEAVIHARAIQDPILEAGAIRVRAVRLKEAGRLEAARAELQRAYELHSTVLETTGHLGLRAAFIEEFRVEMEKLARITLELERKKQDPGAAGHLLRLAEAMRDRRFRIHYTGFGPGARTEKILRLKGELEEVFKLWESSASLESTGRRALFKRMAEVRERYNRLTNEAWQQRPRIDPSTLDPGALRTRLEDALLLMFCLGKEEGFVIAVCREKGVRVFSLACNMKTLEGRVHYLDTTIQRLRPGNEGAFAGPSYTLFRDLFGPVQKAGWMPPGRPLIVVPDRALERLPFHALVTRPGKTGDKRTFRALPYLILRNPIRYLTAAGDLLAAGDRPRKPRFLGVAPGVEVTRLEGAVSEVKALAALFPAGSAATALGEEAAEARLVRRPDLRAFNILHFATHGRASALDFSYSGLVLGTGEDGESDGVLHGYEVRDLGVTPALVTLSACSSGRDMADPGVTGVGWGRVFLEAGASSVLLSIWRVEDRVAPVFMEAFYRSLLDGVRADLALARASRHLIHGPDSERWANPRYWAPFILVGAAVEFRK